MYPEMFCSDRTIEGKDVSFIMIPDFRQTVTVCNSESDCQYYSDTGSYTISKEVNRYGYYNVYANENDRWFIEHDFSTGKLKVFITQWTDEILTPFGEVFNKAINESLLEVVNEYYEKKNTEIRLYFYDSENDILTLSRDYDCSKKYRYSLERFGVEKIWIDERFKKPTKDCFILGTVRRTIGSKRGMLHDFINPMYQVNWNFKKDGDWKSQYEDFIFSDSYYQIEEKLIMLLKFTTRNEYYFDYVMKRIKTNYYRNQNIESADEMAEKFNGEIMGAFKKGNLDKLIKLHNVITAKQDCTDKNFRIYLKDNQAKVFNPSDIIYIEYENGERDFCKTAAWVYQNRKKCKNATCIYLGNLRKKYQISERIV